MNFIDEIYHKAVIEITHWRSLFQSNAETRLTN